MKWLGVCWYQLFFDGLWVRVWGMLLYKLIYFKCAFLLLDEYSVLGVFSSSILPVILVRELFCCRYLILFSISNEVTGTIFTFYDTLFTLNL